MRNITAVTQFIQEVSVMLDKGRKYSVEEVERHIENKDVIEWLKNEFPVQETGIDFSGFDEDNIAFIHDKLQGLFYGYHGNERRKWGIENNGLCLLISWSTEIIREMFRNK